MKNVTFQTDRFHELSDFEIDPAAVRLLPRAFCRRNSLVILGRLPADARAPVTLGVVAPDNLPVLDEVVALLGRPVTVVRFNRFEVDRALQVGFEGAPTGWDTEQSRTLRLPIPRATDASPVPDLVDGLLADAVAAGASDIHLETYFQDVDVRFRVDGLLHQQFTFLSPQNVAEAVSRIKILSGMDIAERRRPQDGRFRVVFLEPPPGGIGDTSLPVRPREHPVDFRVSVVPSPAGEDVVIRILDANQGLLSVRQLGMAPDILDTFQRLLANPEGLIVVTGPTSSGKTTTLYAAIASITGENRKIITAEDPIEYYIDRVNQKQVTPQMSMMDLLRAALRQNPDVLLFGELRDLPSAETAVAASETGHLVLGTVHTSDALGVVTRLRGIGLEDRELASTLLASLGQRLVRRVCAECAVEQEPTPDQERLFGPLLEGRRFLRGAGCPRCGGRGYRSRVGLYELLVVDAELQDCIGDGMVSWDLYARARRKGYRTMTDDGLAKAAAGITTLDELVRVIPYRQILTVREEASKGHGPNA